MFRNNVYMQQVLFFTFILATMCDDVKRKHEEALSLASDAAMVFYLLFENCLNTPMSNQHFLTDDLKSFVNYPSKTTVGFAHKFINNRKFFANMISSTAFKEMLAKDEDQLRRNLIKKLKYCDEAVMDQETLKDFYDREVDQSKL